MGFVMVGYEVNRRLANGRFETIVGTDGSLRVAISVNGDRVCLSGLTSKELLKISADLREIAWEYERKVDQ